MNKKSHPIVKYKALEAEVMASKSDKEAETVHGTGVEIGEKNGASYDEKGVKIKQEKIDTAKEMKILWSADTGFNPEAVEKKKPVVIDLNKIVEVMVIDSGTEDSSLDNSVGSKRSKRELRSKLQLKHDWNKRPSCIYFSFYILSSLSRTRT